MSTPRNRDIRLVRRPTGMPELSDFELVEGPIPVPGSGQVLVRNLYMSVDPYMRGRMSDAKSYVAPFQLGEVLQGGAVGRVTQGNDQFAAGTYVLSHSGWREWFVSSGKDLIRVEPSPAIPVQTYLGVLGITGLTAWAGLTRVADLKEDDRVFVSGAAGAVGSVAIQIARAMGCQLVAGSAGSAEKCAWVEQLGARAINYREEDLGDALEKALPGGIDVYFENVGGAHLEAALDNMRQNGRIAVCGMIGQYNSSEPPAAPRNLIEVLKKRLTVRGFLVLDHMDQRERFLAQMREWIGAGKITWRETVVEGLERAPAALIGLFRGENTGKMLVKLADDD